jgi:hypothetical protein
VVVVSQAFTTTDTEEWRPIMDEEHVVVRGSSTPAGGSVTRETVRRTPSGGELARRVVVFVFGLIQLLLAARIVLLLIGADRGSALVRAIYDLSSVFVAPFEGVLRSDAIGRGGSTLDLAAVVALIGWTILEVIIIAAIGIVRREPTTA